MVFEHIEQLKRKWTDKYVVVDESRPELMRFSGQTGTVKTVNFSGRALVQFDGNNNIGWFDIDPRFLKVIDAPLPKPVKEEKKTEKKVAPAKAETPVAEKAAAKPAAKAGGASVADILAAARGKGAAPQVAVAPATPQPTAVPPAAKAEPGKMSTADILAMARGKKAAESPVAEKNPAAAKPTPPASEVPVTPPAPEPVTAPTKKAATGAKPKDTAGILEYCRRTDGK